MEVWGPAGPSASLRPGAEKKPPPATPVPLSAGLYTAHFVAMATQTLIIHTGCQADLT